MNNNRKFKKAISVALSLVLTIPILISCMSKNLVGKLNNKTELSVGIRKSVYEQDNFKDTVQYRIINTLKDYVSAVNNLNDKNNIKLVIKLYDEDGLKLIDDGVADIVLDIPYDSIIENDYDTSFPYDYKWLYTITNNHNAPKVIDNFDNQKVMISKSIDKLQREYLEVLRNVGSNDSNYYFEVNADEAAMEMLKMNAMSYLIGYEYELRALISEDDDFNFYRLESITPESMVAATKKSNSALVAIVNRLILGTE